VAHGGLHDALKWAYFTPIQQSWALLALGSFRRPGGRNGELIQPFMIAIAICTAVSVVLPSLAMGGEVSSYIPALEALRAGTLDTLVWNKLEGIIQFPSFHAALAVIFTYAARHRWWTLIPFAALNALMLAATPPIGGHYLVDTLAGLAVAVVAIAVSRRLQPASVSANDSRLALPPAAVVSIETTRSTAKRAR
jgi:membrane-associated phospholipid phosphatase